MSPLVDAILREKKTVSKLCVPLPETLYLGGGTPSALPTRELERLLIGLLPVSTGAELTLEMNPTTVSREKAALLHSMGVNRISLGAQSLDAETLSFLGRQHTPELIRRSVKILRDAGFCNINLDLIFGSPTESLEKWMRTLEQAVGMSPEHISAYQLTVEEGTPFAQKLSAGAWVQNEDEDAKKFLETGKFLESAGYGQYEVSNYAKLGFESRHNQAYWRGEDYLGLGPGAVSTVGSVRWTNPTDLLHYGGSVTPEAHGKSGQEILTPEMRQKEKLMLGLRTAGGVVIESGWETALADLLEAGYATENQGCWKLTREGLLRADSIAQLFF